MPTIFEIRVDANDSNIGCELFFLHESRPIRLARVSRPLSQEERHYPLLSIEILAIDLSERFFGELIRLGVCRVCDTSAIARLCSALRSGFPLE